MDSQHLKELCAGDTMENFWLAVSGGVAGSILTIIGQRLMAYCLAPEIHIDFSENCPGCRVQTPATVNDSQVEQHYLRLRIRNNGWTTAKNVSVAVTGVRLDENDFDEEVLDLKTSISAKLTFDLGREGYRFVDLFHLVNQESNVRAEFDFAATPIRFEEITTQRHDFSARLFVSADNATSVSSQIRWQWDGTFGGLAIT